MWDEILTYARSSEHGAWCAATINAGLSKWAQGDHTRLARDSPRKAACRSASFLTRSHGRVVRPHVTLSAGPGGPSSRNSVSWTRRTKTPGAPLRRRLRRMTSASLPTGTATSTLLPDGCGCEANLGRQGRRSSRGGEGQTHAASCRASGGHYTRQGGKAGRVTRVTPDRLPGCLAASSSSMS